MGKVNLEDRGQKRSPKEQSKEEVERRGTERGTKTGEKRRAENRGGFGRRGKARPKKEEFFGGGVQLAADYQLAMMIGSQLAAEKVPRQPAEACRYYHATLRSTAAQPLRYFTTASSQLRADNECLCKPANRSI